MAYVAAVRLMAVLADTNAGGNQYTKIHIGRWRRKMQASLNCGLLGCWLLRPARQPC